MSETARPRRARSAANDNTQTEDIALQQPKAEAERTQCRRLTPEDLPNLATTFLIWQVDLTCGLTRRQSESENSSRSETSGT